MATRPEAPSSSTRRRMHTIAHYDGSRKRRVCVNDGLSEGHANDSTSSKARTTFLHPDELINGDLDLNNPVFANHVKSLMSPTEMARPDFNLLMEEKAAFIREMRSDVRDFARTQIQSIMVRQASKSQMKVKSSNKNGPTLDVVSFEMIRKSWMRDSSVENRGCIFQVTYGWFDHHPRWNIDLESEYMSMRNLMYQSTPSDPANKHQRKKCCIAKHIADIKNNIVKGIRKAGMMAHGVSITITRPSLSITQETKFKKRAKGFEYQVVTQHQQLTSSPSSLPDEQEDIDDDSDYDDAAATETCASDESLTESLESIDWSTDSKDNELFYLCWDSDEEILEIGEDDNRGIASGGGIDSIDEEILVIGEDDNRGIASGGGSDSIGGSGVTSIVPQKSCCWCPHDTSLNHFDTVLGLEAEEQAIYCGVSKKNGQGFYLHGRNCAYCSAKFVVNETPSNNGKNEFRPTRRKPAWACKWMTKTNKVKKTKCTFALCNACFIVLSTMPAEEGGHYERKVNAPILTNM
jgi:hypothetical protein